MKKISYLSASLFLWFSASFLSSCAGPDYTPVYFPGGGGAPKNPTSPDKNPNPSTSAHCTLGLTAKLCVKIKKRDGEPFEAGTKPDDPLCADTPAIPLEVDGAKISMKGSNFPDILVQVNVRGAQVPMTLNGKGSGDGSNNIGLGTWTPEGELQINNFSFFVNVLGSSGEVPHLDLTTGDAKTTPDLPPLKGAPISADGNVTLVTGTVLGHVLDAADKFLMGASLQATFTGTVSPPLAQCTQNAGNKGRQMEVVKVHLDPSGVLSEEPIPEGNILEISKGTFIAQKPQDIGPDFETRSDFKATNNSDKPAKLDVPSHIGPFYFSVEGKTLRTLKPKGSFKFSVSFHPESSNVPQAGWMKENFMLGSDRFYLRGLGLQPAGKTGVNRVDDSGQTVATDIETVALAPLAVPATTAKNFFKCEKIKCGDHDVITQCQSCTPPQVQGCALLPINTEGKPLEEVSKECKPLNPSSLPMMNLDLSGADRLSITPSKQVITIQNRGVVDLKIKNISIQEMAGSKSTGQFQLLESAIRMGESLEKSESATFPVVLPPYQEGFRQQQLFVTVSYLPTDLIGSDGQSATGGVDVLDRAFLKIETEPENKITRLTGKTRVQQVPELQVVFGTATGFKSKSNRETFGMEEVTGTTQDLAVPTFLKLAETAGSGFRITDIHLAGVAGKEEDLKFFEWLNTSDRVATRKPPEGKGKRCSIPVFDPNTGRLLSESFDLNFATVGSQGFDLKPGATTAGTLPLFGCLNFHHDPSQTTIKRMFQADLIVTALKLGSSPPQQSNLVIHLVAAIDPLRGKFVMRVTQTVAAILAPTGPSLTALSAKKEVDMMVRDGKPEAAKELTVMLGALILDPFNEMEITDTNGKVVKKLGDTNGITAVFRAIDTRPSPTNYEDDSLFDFASLMYDSDLPVGHQGIFYDYDVHGAPLPKPLKISGWRIFTGALSYPGPVDPRSPIGISDCDIIDPCDPESLRKFTKNGAGPGDRGACAFFYSSGARYQSPAFKTTHSGGSVDLCVNRNQPQDLLAMDTGHYSVDGSLTMEDLGLRFWGPTYVHNAAGPLGAKPALDEVFHITFTTEMLKPKSSPNDYNMLPEEKLDLSKEEHKMNLDEKESGNPAICESNRLNRTLGGHKYSSWRYFAPMLFKDENGEIPAGCPETGNDFKGGTAFVKGRRIDPATGIFSFVSAGKFSSKEDLTFPFKNVTVFITIHGWLCNPDGDEKAPAFEGAKCFDTHFNDRDAKAQISIVGD